MFNFGKTFSLACLWMGMATNASAVVLGPGASGGGGTINPLSASVDNVFAASYYAKPLLTSWLHGKELEFKNKTTAEQLQSPLRKLFTGSRSIYDIVARAGIEFRSERPCLDRDGKPQDGSILSDYPDSICISSFLIAPKTNIFTVYSETVALIAHEYGHLAEMDEAEAVFLQQELLTFLGRFELATNQHSLYNLKDHLERLTANKYLKGEQIPQWADILLLEKDLSETYALLDTKDLPTPPYQLVWIDQGIFEARMPIYTRFTVLGYYVCATDKNADPGVSKKCSDLLDRGFEGKASTSAGYFLASIDDNSVRSDWYRYFQSKVYYSTILVRPTDLTTFQSELSKLYQDLQSMRKSIVDLLDANPNIRSTR